MAPFSIQTLRAALISAFLLWGIYIGEYRDLKQCCEKHSELIKALRQIIFHPCSGNCANGIKMQGLKFLMSF